MSPEDYFRASNTGTITANGGNGGGPPGSITVPDDKPQQGGDLLVATNCAVLAQAPAQAIPSAASLAIATRRPCTRGAPGMLQGC